MFDNDIQEWEDSGSSSVAEFGAYDGRVLFVKVQESFYIDLKSYGSEERLVLPVESKHWLSMAHWIIKEFG